MAPDIGERLLLISHLVNILSSLNIVFSLKMRSGVSPLVFNAHGRQFTERSRKADARAGLPANCEQRRPRPLKWRQPGARPYQL